MNFTCDFLKEVLDKSLEKMKPLFKTKMGDDPVFFPHLFREKKDIEVAAFLAAQFAYGNIKQINRFLRGLFSKMDEGPYAYIKKGNFSNLRGLFYRFQREDEIVELFFMLKLIIEKYGSLANFFLSHFNGDIRETVFFLREKLNVNERKLFFFFPFRSNSNPLKRWNLFLRWMVRKDEVDFGIWDFLEPRMLLVPLDVHIFSISRCLGLTKRKTKDAKTVMEITEKLRTICPEDPLKYDFLLCHFVGVENRCKGEPKGSCIGRCIFWVPSIS